MPSLEETVVRRADLRACYQCGKCTGGCPVALKSKLNIRRLVMEGVLDRHLHRLSERRELWDCTTCKTCSLRCPRDIQPMDLILSLRSVLVEEGHIPKTLIDALEGVHKHGNPWGQARERRTDWTMGLASGSRVKDFSRGDRAEFLYFVGCTPSFDPRTQEIARAFTFALLRARVDFGILGNEEQCCGNEIRSMGESGLFEELVVANTKRFEAYGIKRILTTCPHGYNAFKNEYPPGNVEVTHSSQILMQCLEAGKLSFVREIDKVVTFHDPCFLGKQNGLFDEPRKLLEALPGLTIRELDRSRERSLCCEGGGGRMWVEASSDSAGRLAESRVKDAAELGADIIATACPLCVLTLEDAVKTTGHEETLQVMDVNELLAVALGLESPRLTGQPVRSRSV